MSTLSHSTALFRKVPVACDEKPVMLMMRADRQFINYLGNGSFDQPVTVLSRDCTSMDGTLDLV